LAQLVEDKLDFAHSGTIEATAKGRQKADNDWIRIALYCVERFDHGELADPLVILVYDGSEVCDKERCLVCSVSDTGIDQLRDATKCVNVENIFSEVSRKVSENLGVL
jgi:hypothetical protein